MIDWVEKSEMAVTLNSIILSDDQKGNQHQLCAWPLRPLWKNNGTTMQRDVWHSLALAIKWLPDLVADYN
ncbi:tannase [Penicillium sp. IBT 35674x]|nr:tannase [Penicillium sp. IBT 35674x]